MFSEDLGLHEALAKLDAKDRRVKAALAAAQANWHASRRAWPEAVASFDRLAAADPASRGEWLRTPGLLRLATALVHQNRPGDAAALLAGGARRRAADGIPPAALRVSNDPATGELLDPLREAVNERLAKAPRDAGLLELRAELASQWSDANAQVADYTAAIEALAQQKPEAAADDLKRLYWPPRQRVRRPEAVGAGGRRLCPCRDHDDSRRGIADKSGNGARGGHSQIADGGPPQIVGLDCAQAPRSEVRAGRDLLRFFLMTRFWSPAPTGSKISTMSCWASAPTSS